MKFGGIGPLELIIILAVVLLIFGPKNLPKLGAAIGKSVKNLRDGMGKSKEEAEEVIEEVEEAEEVVVEAAPAENTAASATPKRVVKVVKKESPKTE